MKKILIITLMILTLFALTSCYPDDEYRDSLEEYIERKNNSKNSPEGAGFHDAEIDMIDCFLPSKTFFEDFKYVDGGYRYYQYFRLFGERPKPDIVLLYLRYDESIYADAKVAMLEGIPKHGEELYIYNNYTFYRNANYVAYKKDFASLFPSRFTMAGYNDTNRTLIFIGMFGGPREYDNLSENWVSFIDTYYSEYYDFSE